MLHYTEARQRVVSIVSRQRPALATETVPLAACAGRVLAMDVTADRDYPPFNRSTRDGYALRAADIATVPASLRRAGEIRAGEAFQGRVSESECVQIMTGAPVPDGADAVVMIEHTEMKGDQVLVKRVVPAGVNIVPRGSEARREEVLVTAGTPIGYPQVSLLGQVGCAQVPVFRRPRVAVLSTGDEVVAVEDTPGPVQIRNSNSYSLAAQILEYGGEPVLLGNARDEIKELERLVRRGLEEDLLLITGGVSMGKYDLVEVVLRGLGSEFHFDEVAIRPGRPAVFATCRGKFVFGLPGNPVSTMVTFELFAAPALAILAGAPAPALRFLKARLAVGVEQRTNLTMFLPARLEGEGSEAAVRAVSYQGSGDAVAVARADCYLVVPEAVKQLEAGELVDVLLRRG